MESISEKTPRQRLLATLLLLLVTLLWGASFVVTKNVADVFPIISLVAIRFLASGLVLGLLFFRRLRLITRSILLRGSILGVLYAVASVLQTIGVKLTTPGKSAFLTAAHCMLVPLVAWVLMRARPTLKNLFAAVVCLTGIGLVSLTETLSILPGDLFTLACALIFAVHIVCISKFVSTDDVMLLNIVQFLVGGALLLVPSLLTESWPATISPTMLWGLLYLSLICTAFALVAQAFSQTILPAATVSIVLSFEAVFGAVSSAVMYGERFTPRMLAGFAFIFIAVLISEMTLKKEKLSYN